MKARVMTRHEKELELFAKKQAESEVKEMKGGIVENLANNHEDDAMMM